MKLEMLSRVGNLAVVGATGLVGREIVTLLEENRIPGARVKRLTATDSFEEALDDPEDQAGVELLKPEAFVGVEAVFFATPAAVTRKFLPFATDAGCVVVDDSGAFQQLTDVPIVVPEVNGAELRGFDGKVIANPAPATTALALVMKPILDKFGIRRAVVATYQSASELGLKGYQELSEQTVQLLNGGEMTSDLLPHPLAFNCLPLVGGVTAEGDSEEEARIRREVRRILDTPELALSVTAVRVPTFSGLGAVVNLELERPCDLEAFKEALDGFESVKVLDNPGANIYPTNRECNGADFVFVGRLRRDPSVEAGLSLWIMTDNLRKGAALNALGALETLYRYRRES